MINNFYMRECIGLILFYLIPAFMGGEIAAQSAVNSKLQNEVGSPYLASTISFFIGTSFLSILSIITHQIVSISVDLILNNPWWMWVGGLTSAFSLTANVLLFSRLGSVQTSVLPIVGQIVMSMIIDQFGLFHSTKESLNIIKIFSILILLIGALLSANIITRKSPIEKLAESQHHNNLFWQIIGIISGALLSIQAAVNGYFGKTIHSSILAAWFTCLVAFLSLLIISLLFRIQLRKGIKKAIQSTSQNWWIWIGGLLGSSYVMLSAQLVPIMGTGKVIIIALFGQLTFSTLIDNFGWLSASQHHVSKSQILGLLLMLIGIIGVNLH